MSDSIVADIQAAAAEMTGEPAEVEAPATAAAEPAVKAPAPADPERAERARGPDGKFTTKPKEEPAEAAAEPEEAPGAPAAKSEPEATPKPAAPAMRPPQSWKPTVREKWGSLPPDVQEEVQRRERETQAAMQQSAGHRRTAEALERVVAPYRAIIPGDPLQVTQAALQTVTVLRTGTHTEKAGLLAGLVRDSGVPIEALAAALDGKAPPQQAQPQQEFRDPRFDQYLAQQREQQRQQVASEVETFTAGLDFIEDVRDDMAMILAGAGQRGLPMDLKEAYDRACGMNPEVRKVLQQREEAKARATATAATQKAKAAASSVQSRPSGMRPPKKDGTPTDDVREAYEELMSGR